MIDPGRIRVALVDLTAREFKYLTVENLLSWSFKPTLIPIPSNNLHEIYILPVN